MDTNKGCMKKVLLTLALMLGACTTTFAQSTKDVLYLKNGSIIYGQLIEMVPEKQVKIKTTDGSVFVYNTSEVDRIAKAETKEKENYTERKSSFRTRKIATGFKGFIDDSYSASMNGSDFNRGGLSVSLGSQILPQLFVGAGLGLEYYTEPEVLTVPVFADVRVNFINGPISPFLGVKVGYTALGDFEGFYLNPMIGCRFGLTNKLALHTAIGYALQNADYTHEERYYSPYGTTTFRRSISTFSAIKIQFGFEF